MNAIQRLLVRIFKPALACNALFGIIIVMVISIVLGTIIASLVIFFFQAEDGIRDGRVTGVQTCALPILSRRFWPIRCRPACRRLDSAVRPDLHGAGGSPGGPSEDQRPITGLLPAKSPS